jgi:hypothetical protein
MVGAKDEDMNTYVKYAPNVYLALCGEPHEKGETITVTTQHGKENECIVHNLIVSKENRYYYSVTRADGFNSQQRAANRADKLQGYAANAEQRADKFYQASQERREFLLLGEPIKVGHHSEKRHRALIERNWSRMGKSVAETEKAQEYEARAAYWERMKDKIDLSMPESIEYFEHKLEVAKKTHQEYLTGKRERSHSFSLTYAKKAVNETEKSLKTAKLLWS